MIEAGLAVNYNSLLYVFGMRNKSVQCLSAFLAFIFFVSCSCYSTIICLIANKASLICFHCYFICVLNHMPIFCLCKFALIFKFLKNIFTISPSYNHNIISCHQFFCCSSFTSAIHPSVETHKIEFNMIRI